MTRTKQAPPSRTTMVADIASLETRMEIMVRAVEKAAADLSELRESLAFLSGNRRAAFAWGGLFLSLLGGGVGAAVAALLDHR